MSDPIAPLKEHDNWVEWNQDDEQPKRPYSPDGYPTGHDTDKADQWGSYNETGDERGFVITGTPFWFIDIDALGLDEESGEFVCKKDEEHDCDAERAGELVKQYNQSTYWERSPSGDGFHGVFRDEDSETVEARKGAHVEIYGTSRYMTVTGDELPEASTGSIDEIEMQDAVTWFDRHTTEDEDAGSHSGSAEPDGESQLDDTEVVQKIRDSDQAETFDKLMDGDYSDYPSQSEADQAFMNILAFWCSGDTDQMDRIMRMSGLMREKWDDHPSYAEDTMQNAVDSCDSFYGQSDWDTVRWMYGNDDISPAAARTKAHEVLLDNNDFVTMMDTEEMYRYNPETGIFEEGAEQFVGAKLDQELGSYYSINTRSTIIQRLKDATWTDRDDMGADLNEPLVAFTNCVVDISTRARYEHSPEHKLMTRLEAEYDPDAECNEFDSMLEDRIGDDQHIKSFYEMVASSIAPGIPLDNFVVMHGPPGTGKSTMLKVVQKMLGDDNVASERLHRLAHDNHAMTSLYGKRANFAGDMDGGEVKRTALLLQLSGGDTITANPKGKQPFEFEPSSELVFATNELPRFHSNLEAIMRRLVVIEVPNEVPEEEYEASHAVLNRLATDDELSGLANKAIEAYNRLMEQHKFTVNTDASLDQRMRRYRLMEDPVSRFTENLCLSNPGWHTPKAKVYDAYVKWCEDVGTSPVTKGELTEKLAEDEDLMVNTSRPSASAHDHLEGDTGRVRCYSGIQLNDDGKAAVKALRKRKQSGDSSLAE